MPIEIIMNLEGYEDGQLVDTIRETNGIVRNYRDWAFEYSEAEWRVSSQFGDVEVSLPQDKPFAIRARGMLVYLERKLRKPSFAIYAELSLTVM